VVTLRVVTPLALVPTPVVTLRVVTPRARS
jgi:hypothetical protein